MPSTPRQRKRQRERARRIEARLLRREARKFGLLMIATLARLGAMYAARWRYDTGPNAGSRRRRKRTQYVQFQLVKTTSEQLWYKILIGTRTLFGYRDRLPHMTTASELMTPETLRELSLSVERQVTASDDPKSGAWLVVHRLEGLDGLPKLIKYGSVLDHVVPATTAALGQVLIGIGAHRTPVYISLAKQPHWLFAGATGSGKSNAVRCALAQLIRNATPQDLQLILIDLKRVELVVYKNAPHLYQPPVFNVPDALKTLQAMCDLIEKRTEIISGRAREISIWNDSHPDQKIPRVLIVIDEFAELTIGNSNVAAREQIVRHVERISSLGRAVGVHLLIATQRPSVKAVPSSIKINCDALLCGRVQNKVQSVTILGVGNAASLPLLPGRMLLGTGSELSPVQVPLTTDDDTDNAIAVAIGRASGAITISGPEVVIMESGLVADIVRTFNGELAIGPLWERYGAMGVSKRDLARVLQLIVVQGGYGTEGQWYALQKQGKSLRLAGTGDRPATPAAPAPILLASDPPTITPAPRERAFTKEHERSAKLTWLSGRKRSS